MLRKPAVRNRNKRWTPAKKIKTGKRQHLTLKAKRSLRKISSNDHKIVIRDRDFITAPVSVLEFLLTPEAPATTAAHLFFTDLKRNRQETRLFLFGNRLQNQPFELFEQVSLIGAHQAEVADFDKAPGQDMLQITPEKLHDLKTASLSFLSFHYPCTGKKPSNRHGASSGDDPSSPF